MVNKYHGDYDYANAPLGATKNGHYPSINPDTGAFLKGEGHPTYDLGVEGERQAGNIVGTIRKKKISIPTTSKGFLLK